MKKGLEKCSLDDSCHGIHFPFRDGDKRQSEWFQEKKGVLLCLTYDLVRIEEDGSNLYMKGMYIKTISDTICNHFKECSRHNVVEMDFHVQQLAPNCQVFRILRIHVLHSMLEMMRMRIFCQPLTT